MNQWIIISNKQAILFISFQSAALYQMIRINNISINYTPLPGRAIKSGFSCPAIIQLAEAQLGLYKTFKPMGTFLTRSPHITSQLIV